jgi:7,8-dihydropterin-6-yl-methyl-4-(beta-D-ribofuranosyl)aminobenzene 5'-phosphate synthase
MHINITTLSENTATTGFIGEWGLSMLIEADDKRILLDAGGPHLSAISNAQLLGIDLRTIDLIVLSHGHYDHTGGLRDLLIRRGAEVDIIAHPDIWGRKYSFGQMDANRYIGLPFLKEHLESLGARFSLSREPIWITDNIVTSGEVPMVTGYEETDQTLFIKDKDGAVRDTFTDDLSIAVKTGSGLAIFLGCAHRGMINIIRRFQEITGDERIYSVVGGTHLISASGERMTRTIADLKETGIRRLGCSHCTGFNASARLAAEFKDIFFLNAAGSSHMLL